MTAVQSWLRRWLWPRSRGVKLAVVAAGAFIAVIALWTAAYVATERRLAAAWKFSEKRFGLSNDLATLVGPPVPEEENAAVPFQQVIELAKSRYIERQTDPRQPYRVGSLPIPVKFTSPQSLLADSAYETAWVDADRRPCYHTLADLSEPLWRHDGDRIADVGFVTAAELALARWLAANGRNEEAVSRLLRYLRVLHKWQGKEPGPGVSGELFGSNARISIFFELDGLLRRSGRFSPGVYNAVEQEIARHCDVLRPFLFAAQCEKIALADFVAERAPCRGMVGMQPYSNLDTIALLECFNRSMETLTLPQSIALEAQDRILKEREAERHGVLAKAFYPVTNQWTPATAILHRQKPWVTVLAQCVRIVNAMAAKGDFNAAVETLDLPPDCIVDPFDGKPLRVKRTPRGPVVYSIGHNGVDDGGALGDAGGLDIGLGPPKTRDAAK
jgi:hypothetical protein